MVERVKESWNSHWGVILAVAGSAVGLGNFLRFPGQAAQHGGGAFMIAYFISFILLGLPICWAEWTIGREGGRQGFNSCPGILAKVTQKNGFKWFGIVGVIIPIIIYMYYVYIEAWCLGYAVNFLKGNIHFTEIGESTGFWVNFIGATQNGSAIAFGWEHVGFYLIFAFLINFVLIYRGISKGIELFCTYAMPTLVLLALIVLIRVLTLGTPDPAHPDRSINNGLGFMWNPQKQVLQKINQETGTWETQPPGLIIDSQKIEKTKAEIAKNPTLRLHKISLWEQLLNPQIWLAAAGQIFFSLSVGFGLILTYSSYMSEKDDVVISALSATSANEFCEVALGGLITLPAAFVFMGTAGLIGTGLGTFDLGFKILPLVFSTMPAGSFFGFLFFFLLFLAAVTSSLSMLQPGIALLEEAWQLKRKKSVAILGILTALGSGFVVYFSADAKALDTLDFWVGTFLIFILATIEIIIFSWVIGVDKGLKIAHQGAILNIPKIFRPIMKYICPLFLITIFTFWALDNFLGIRWNSENTNASYYINDLIVDKNPVSWMSLGLIVIVAIFLFCIVGSSKTLKAEKKGGN